MRGKSTFWNSKSISFISGVSFLFVICIIFASNFYMNSRVQHESESQNHRYELSRLGEELAEASDYLTDEVRKYAITGDITHLYNYWYEINEAKTRDNVIKELTGYNPPGEEKELLEEAKSFSDQLVTIETYSMKMMLLSADMGEYDDETHNLENSKKQISEKERNEIVNKIENNKNHAGGADIESDKLTEYVSWVLFCELPEAYQNLTPNEMRETAFAILYDDAYMNAKSLIMTPIDEFQTMMNERLNSDVAESVQGRNRALILQSACLVIAVLLTGFILLAFHYLYISPLKNYTSQLRNKKSDDGEWNLARIRIRPKGAYELREFGRIFNGLSCLLFREVEKSARAENNMRIAKEEAVNANRAKSDFLARMSHELRTPLNAITGYVYLLNGTELDHTQRRYCDSIQSSSDSLLGLISDILDFSKIESGNMILEKVPFSLMNLIKDIYNVMENSAHQKGIQLKLDICSDFPAVVQGDELKLRQILMNLIGNAVKFTEKGSITIGLETVNRDEELVNIRFVVADTGIGIAPEQQKMIFEPFVQSDAGTTRKYGGTGLGLAISKQIIEQCSHGKETLQLESREGEGSQFSFIMPFTIGEVSQLEDDMEEMPDNLDEEKVVLLVDDNEINIQVEAEILASFGVSVVTATSGPEAIAYVKEHKVDLIFMDIRMPDMDGYEASCKIRLLGNGQSVPIIALSADAIEGVREKVLSFGMNDYVTKPLKPVRLKQIMQQYFQLSKEGPVTVPVENGRYFQAEECLNNLNHNERLLIKLCKQFLKGQGNTAMFIEQHLKDANVGNVLCLLHDLKGLSGNLCLEPLYHAVVEFEDKLRNRQVTDYAAFKATFDATIQEVNDYVDEKAWYFEENANKEPYEQIREKFIYLCQQYDVVAVELFQDSASEFVKHMSKPDYRELEDAILKYDFELALQILEVNADV